MSFFYYDGSTLPRAELNKATQLYKRFDKYWPKTVVNGHLVYKNKSEPFYVNGFVEDSTTKRFAKALGMNWTELTNQDIDNEIETMYFRLNHGFEYSGERAFKDPVEPTIPLVAPTLGQIAASLNSQFEVGDTVDVTVSYGGTLKRYVNTHSLTWTVTGSGIRIVPLNTDEIRATLASNPWYYYANSRHIEYVPDNRKFHLYNGGNPSATSISGIPTPRSTPTCTVATTIGSLGVTALLDNSSVFQPMYETDGNGDEILKISNEIVSTDSVGIAGEVLNYRYTLSFTYKGCSASSQLVKDLHEWYSHYYPNMSDIPSEFTKTDKVITSQLDTKIKRELASMMVDGDPFTDDSLYTKEAKNIYTSTPYLKVAAVKDMKKREFVELLSNSVTTDYSVESRSWYETVIAIVLVIVAIVVSFYTAGGAAGFAASFVTAASTFAGTLALTLTISSMIMSEVGGLSSQGLVKNMGKFAAIAGIVGTVLGIYAFFNNLLRQAIVTEAAKEGTTHMTESMIASEISKMSAMDMVVAMSTEAVKSATSSITNVFTSEAMSSVSSFSNASFDALKTVMKGYDFYMDQEAKKLNKEMQALKKEEAEYNESILNKPYMQTAGMFMLNHEKLATPDMLQDLAVDIDSRVGMDDDFRAWNTSVNS